MENLPVTHLEESEPNHHVVRVGWSVDSTTYQLGKDLEFLNISMACLCWLFCYMNCNDIILSLQQGKIRFRTATEVPPKFLRIMNSKTTGCLSN